MQHTVDQLLITQLLHHSHYSAAQQLSPYCARLFSPCYFSTTPTMLLLDYSH